MIKKLLTILFTLIILSSFFVPKAVYAGQVPLPCVPTNQMTPSKISNYNASSKPNYGTPQNPYTTFSIDNTGGDSLVSDFNYEVYFYHDSDVFQSAGPVIAETRDWGKATWKDGKLVFTVPPGEGFWSPSNDPAHAHFFFRRILGNGQIDSVDACQQGIDIVDSRVDSGVCSMRLVDATGNTITAPKPIDDLYVKVDNVPNEGTSRYLYAINAATQSIDVNKSACIPDAAFSVPLHLGTGLTGKWSFVVKERCGSDALFTAASLCGFTFESKNSGGTTEAGTPCYVCPTDSTWLDDTQKCISNDSAHTDVTSNGHYVSCDSRSACNPLHSETANPVCIPGQNSGVVSRPDNVAPPCSEENPKLNCKKFSSGLGFDLPTDPEKFINVLFGVVLSLSGGIALILIIIAGYRLIASQGNPERIQAAREQLTAAIVGLLFIIFSLVFLETLGVDILNIPGFGK